MNTAQGPVLDLTGYRRGFLVAGLLVDIRRDTAFQQRPRRATTLGFDRDRVPDRDHAEQWYKSAAYQEIVPLRADNSIGTVF